jgi:serine phosphatase RsbU (regulator of sigma subunit)/pSer/pThr/pTyr-binding forkhead associated (FHA) protein
MPKLVVELGDLTGSEFRFDHELVIGRDPACDVAIPERIVSRHHAMLRWNNDECYVVDLGSANGTFINGRRIAKPARLRAGDTIVIGSTQFRLLLNAEPPPLSGTSATVTWSERHTNVRPDVTMSARRSELSALALLDPVAANAAAGRQLQFLDKLGKASSRGFGLAALVEFVAAELHTLLPLAQRVGVLLRSEDDHEVILAVARSRQGPLAEYQASRALIDRVLANRESVLVAGGTESSGWMMGVPIVFDDRLYGAIQIDAEGPPPSRGETDLALLTAVATHIGLALAYERVHSQAIARELIGRDLALARHVQEHFLPQQAPKLAGYRLAVAFDPVLDIGGDFFDVIRLGEPLVGLAVGDVCGKGIAAALYGAKVISDLRHLAVGQTEPAAILSRLNRTLAERNQTVMFVTLAFISLHLPDGRIRIASAGQPLPVVRRGSGEVSSVGRTGDSPVGVAEDSVFQQYDDGLAEGDVLLMHSDGVTEALSEEGEPFGESRLMEAVGAGGPAPDDVIKHVRAALAEFTRGAPQSDDITLLCIGAGEEGREGQPAP